MLFNTLAQTPSQQIQRVTITFLPPTAYKFRG